MVKKTFFLCIILFMTICLSSCSIFTPLDDVEWRDRRMAQGTPIDLKLYGKYAENISENFVEGIEEEEKLRQKFKSENSSIKKSVEMADLTGYYTPSGHPYKYKPYIMDENSFFDVETFTNIDNVPIVVRLSYKVEVREEVLDHEDDTIYSNYFPEPLVSVSFMIANTNTPSVENRLLYTTEGELVGESGKWFLFVDRDEYANYYLKEALRIIGK